MYCPTDWHDNHSDHHDLETLQSCWLQIANKTEHKNLTYKISFTGGEVTTNKHFLPFVSWLRSQPQSMQIFVTSNGSASTNYYKRLVPFINGLSLSTHGEYIDEKKFFSKCRIINSLMERPHQSLHINLMDEVWNRDRIDLYKTFCETHALSYSVNEINWSKKIRTNFLIKGKNNIDQI